MQITAITGISAGEAGFFGEAIWNANWSVSSADLVEDRR
jgi:hypothetical protein